MKNILLLLFVLCTINTTAQQSRENKYPDIDTVTIVALGKKTLQNIPYQIKGVNLKALQSTPRPQLMMQLALLPSVSTISSGTGINKPVIRGLSFNHIQLFANGTRIDNQTWDDRHDIGISDNGFDRVEIINGPAALIYGPNTLGGAIVMQDMEPHYGEKNNGYVRLGIFSNSIGANLNAGFKGSRALKQDGLNSPVNNRSRFYYSASTGVQVHTNYLQGEDNLLAANSKFTNIAFKGNIGIEKEKSKHRLTYNFYKQNLGIVEDEGPGIVETERDYEMEAPYQDISTHVLSLENNFKAGNSEIIFNAGYQYNKRSEFEPDSLPKSKFLGVGLDLQTLTGDLQWHSNVKRSAKFTAGLQAFYQNNRNFGNFVLVPDSHVSTFGVFVIGNIDLKKLNILYGLRTDIHHIKMFSSLPKKDDGITDPLIPAPLQSIMKQYNPYSFSAGIVYHLAKSWSIKLNIANGNAAPNYAQLAAYGKHEGTYRFEIGDNDLKMEKNIEADAGIECQTPSITVSLNGYINSINDYIYITPTADSAGNLRVYRWTQKDANISGIEADINFHPVNMKSFESYLRIGNIQGRLKNGGGYLPYIPASKLIAGFTWKNNPKKRQQLYATIQFDLYSEQTHIAQFEAPTKGCFLTDIFIGAMPFAGGNQRWGYTVFCTNIFNKSYFNHLSLTKSINIREPARNIGIQLQYKF